MGERKEIDVLLIRYFVVIFFDFILRGEKGINIIVKNNKEVIRMQFKSTMLSSKLFYSSTEPSFSLYFT